MTQHTKNTLAVEYNNDRIEIEEESQQKKLFSLQDFLHKHLHVLVLGGILAFGAYLRLLNVNWDSDQHLHPDERFLTMVSTGIRFPSSLFEYFSFKDSPLNPYNNNYGFFVYGTFPIFFTKVIAALLNKDNYGDLTIVGRVLSTLFDLGSVLVVYGIGRKLFSRTAGILAAFFLAMTAMHIQLSHFFGVETYQAFFIALTFYFLLLFLQGSRLENKIIRVSKTLLAEARKKRNPVPPIEQDADEEVQEVTTIDHPDSVVSRDYSHIFAKGIILAGVGIVFGLALASKVSSLLFAPIILLALASGYSKDILMKVSSIRRITLRYVLYGFSTFFTALLTFRIFQPYAFDGLFSFASQWTRNMAEVSVLMKGSDVPPSIQWVDRPITFVLQNMLSWAAGHTLGIAMILGTFLLAGWIIRYAIKHRSAIVMNQTIVGSALLLLWSVTVFAYYSKQFVKPGRYLSTFYPFGALLAAFFVWKLLEYTHALVMVKKPGVASKHPLVRGVGLVCAACFILGTLGWAVAVSNIYRKDHSRVAASYWIFANIPEGATIGNEHWDDGLPLRVGGKDGFGGYYKGENFNNYYPTNQENIRDTLDKINKSDYIILSSNRLYLSIPRLPKRYPATIEYYNMLFSGELGFDLIKTFSSYPHLFGMEFNDDYVDESFTVYDHPKVLIFEKNKAKFDLNAISAKLLAFPDGVIEPLTAGSKGESSKKSVLLSEEIKEANLEADTSQYFIMNKISRTTFYLGPIPIPLAAIVWWAALEILGLAVFPLLFSVFTKFQDRGYGLTKIFGLLFSAWLVWILGSFKLLQFTTSTILFVLAIVTILSFGVLFLYTKKKQSPSFLLFLQERWKLLLGLELLFTVGYIFFVAIRMMNPDIWQPWTGGEKIFESAFFAGIIRSVYFPPADTWYAGGYINYYYFGLYLIAFLVKLTGVVQRVAFNLAIPTIFAFTLSATYSILYSLLTAVLGKPHHSTPSDDTQTNDSLTG